LLADRFQRYPGAAVDPRASTAGLLPGSGTAQGVRPEGPGTALQGPLLVNAAQRHSRYTGAIQHGAVQTLPIRAGVLLQGPAVVGAPGVAHKELTEGQTQRPGHFLPLLGGELHQTWRAGAAAAAAGALELQSGGVPFRLGPHSGPPLDWGWTSQARPFWALGRIPIPSTAQGAAAGCGRGPGPLHVLEGFGGAPC